MELSYLADYIPNEETIGRGDTQITGLCTDSKKIKKGDLFICYAGKRVDSHKYYRQAEADGAAGFVCEKRLDTKLPQIVVKDGRKAIAQAARAFYGFPDEKLKMVGVTGTNGKTTTTYMLKSIFEAAGRKCAIIGTLGIEYCDKSIAPELTTPDPIFLHSVLADIAECGVEYVFMEVSAHALYFGKTEGITFEVGIFTNCTQDHLDFFGDMKSYADCKKQLFKSGVCKHTVSNADDSVGLEIINSCRGAVSYGLNNPSDVFAVNIRERLSGTGFVMNLFDELYEIQLCLPAVHNVYNALAAASCASLLGIQIDKIAAGLRNLVCVPGRLERVARYNGGEIFIDFAHTPDGLEKSLGALRRLCSGKLYCLFGCGGNRDRSKRPIMGAVAAKYADFCIITSDNPRYEDAYDIISEIEEGIRPSGKKYVTVTDRETATEYAVRLLEKGDILLVAGKGGETYQEILGIKHSYNDGEVIKKIIS